jgi:hypothetical protein
MARLEKRKPATFKVERRAQFSETVDAYLDSEKIDEMFQPFWGGRVLEQQDEGQVGFAYYGHADPSKANANFAISIGHLEQSPIPDEYGNHWHHVIIDYMHVYKPIDYIGHTLDYVQIEKDLEKLLPRFRSLVVFSFDQWNSISLIAHLRATAKELGLRINIKEETFTRARNQKVAEQYKSVLNLGWVHSFKDTFFNDGEGSLLETELKFLMERFGVVMKQSVGPCTTKDLADTHMEVVTQLLTKQLEQWGRSLMSSTKPAIGLQGGYPRTNVHDTPFSRELQLNEQPQSDGRQQLSRLYSSRGYSGDNRLRGR